MDSVSPLPNELKARKMIDADIYGCDVSKQRSKG